MQLQERISGAADGAKFEMHDRLPTCEIQAFAKLFSILAARKASSQERNQVFPA